MHPRDRLSSKYAYQVLLTEEFACHRVGTIFLKAPYSGTPEDQLMLQLQGMIASMNGHRFSNDPVAAG
nr:hypothetical protein [Rhizobium sp. NBRC 114257]